MKGNTQLNQFFTPVWAAERIVQHYYPNLSENDVVADIGCGDGRFLMALPDHVKAYGIEVDPCMAQQARNNSGREVITGDFTEIELPEKPTLFLGNPPFEMSKVNSILERAYESLEYNQEAGFILPVYFFQTADTVMDYSKKWTLKHDLLPRNMFQNMQKPIMFARFIKDKQPVLFGMFLYDETTDILSLKMKYRLKFLGNESSTHLWGEVIEQALASLGGTATLNEIYREIEGKRPTKTMHWKAQIRKVLRDKFAYVSKATYALERNIATSTKTQLSLFA